MEGQCVVLQDTVFWEAHRRAGFLTFTLTPAECRVGSVALSMGEESTAPGGTGTLCVKAPHPEGSRSRLEPRVLDPLVGPWGLPTPASCPHPRFCKCPGLWLPRACAQVPRGLAAPEGEPGGPETSCEDRGAGRE